ncbi:MAG TPA: hypothetical protein VEQ63_07045 [Bryobacteraceae bacterium]|nr:hypothetical protein [Bryobacteraceae bacterium]
MTLPPAIARLVADPPPDHVFELSESGIAYASAAAGQLAFEPVEPDAMMVSPLSDNVLRPDILTDKIRSLASAGGSARKRGKAVLILPDFCARVAVLDFEKFPTDPREQLSLVRFRMKKSVPFDVESAAISYHPQVAKRGSQDVSVVVVVAALEIVGRYESLFRSAGLHPGLVTTSVIAMSELCPLTGVSIVARLSGKALTVAVYDNSMLRLVRCVELQEAGPGEILSVLFPTLAFTEDEIGSRPDQLRLCGFGHDLDLWRRELDIPVEPLQSRYGTPASYNAGLLGFLQSVSSGGVRIPAAGAKVA